MDSNYAALLIVENMKKHPPMHNFRQKKPLFLRVFSAPGSCWALKWWYAVHCRFVKELRLLPDRLRAVTLWEPPCADPHAQWCGGRGRKPPAIRSDVVDRHHFDPLCAPGWSAWSSSVPGSAQNDVVNAAKVFEAGSQRARFLERVNVNLDRIIGDCRRGCRLGCKLIAEIDLFPTLDQALVDIVGAV